MAWRRRAAVLIAALAVALAAPAFAGPSLPEAKANVACAGVSPAATVIGAIGFGDPIGDACNAVTDPFLGVAGHVLDPLKDAAKSLSNGVFNQITTWAADGAVWLLGEVVELTQKTTSPDLLGKGFLRQYRQMAQIATVLALLMVLFAALESLGRGDGGMLVRVFLVNVPLAAIATSAAYVVVQLLIAATDGFSEVIASSTASDTRAFFKGAVAALAEAGGAAGAVAGTAAGGPAAGTAEGAAAGATGVPLFVGFIAAAVAAFAAFLVWIELLMRDATIYVVALFMPMAIAASIWPRWTSALRRTAELLIVVVFSKFVIVAIIALAASLLAHTEGKVEQVLAAGALLLLACFAPLVLFKLVPFAESAVSSAYGRQGARGSAVQAAQLGGSVSMMRRAAQANWAGGSKGGSSTGEGGGSSGGAGGKGRPVGPGGGSAGGAGEAAAASGGAAGVAALPATAGVGAAKTSKAASERLSGTAGGQASTEAGTHSAPAGGAENGAKQASGSEERTPRPRSERSASAGEQGSSSQTSSTPEPAQAGGGKALGSGAKPPRPAAAPSATSKGGSGAKAKP
jgi:type IV secretion system protein TrbL